MQYNLYKFQIPVETNCYILSAINFYELMNFLDHIGHRTDPQTRETNKFT